MSQGRKVDVSNKKFAAAFANKPIDGVDKEPTLDPVTGDFISAKDLKEQYGHTSTGRLMFTGTYKMMSDEQSGGDFDDINFDVYKRHEDTSAKKAGVIAESKVVASTTAPTAKFDSAVSKEGMRRQPKLPAEKAAIQKNNAVIEKFLSGKFF